MQASLHARHFVSPRLGLRLQHPVQRPKALALARIALIFSALVSGIVADVFARVADGIPVMR